MSKEMELPGADSDLGIRLKWVREKRLGLRSEQALSDRLGALEAAERPSVWSQPTVGRYERGGRAKVPVDYVVALARMARVNLRWLATGEGEWNAPDGPDAIPLELLAYRQMADIVHAVDDALTRPIPGSDEDGTPDEVRAASDRLEEVESQTRTGSE